MQSVNLSLEGIRSALTTPRKEGFMREVDRMLDGIRVMGDPSSIPALFAFLDDTDPSQEAMWSIVHLLESFDDSSYFKGLLEGLVTLNSKAPGWAATIHARILNDPPSILGYMKVLAFSTPEQRFALRKVISTIVREEPSFEKSSIPLIQILNSLDGRENHR